MRYYNSNTKKITVSFLFLFLTGCAGIKIPFFSFATPETPLPGSEMVVVSKIAPASGSMNKGSIVATHGGGCGFGGFKGNWDGAIIATKNKAVQMGANYVQIQIDKGPYSDGECAHNEYRIEGNAYKTIEPYHWNLSEYQTTPLMRTCKEIFDNDNSHKGGYYEIDVDGPEGNLEPFQVYCDMTHEGGGWTLFANHKDGVAILTSIDKVGPNETGMIRSDRWIALRNLMSTGMVFVDEHHNISMLSAEKLRSGNCATINNIDDLTDLQDRTKPVNTATRYIYHNENSGCNGTGQDYTIVKMLGDRTSNYSTHGAALFQGSNIKFDIWPYKNSFQSSLEQNQLLCFIK